MEDILSHFLRTNEHCHPNSAHLILDLNAQYSIPLIGGIKEKCLPSFKGKDIWNPLKFLS